MSDLRDRGWSMGAHVGNGHAPTGCWSRPPRGRRRGSWSGRRGRSWRWRGCRSWRRRRRGCRGRSTGQRRDGVVADHREAGTGGVELVVVGSGVDEAGVGGHVARGGKPGLDRGDLAEMPAVEAVVLQDVAGADRATPVGLHVIADAGVGNHVVGDHIVVGAQGAAAGEDDAVAVIDDHVMSDLIALSVLIKMDRIGRRAPDQLVSTCKPSSVTKSDPDGTYTNPPVNVAVSPG